MNPATYRKITGQYDSLVNELEAKAMQIAQSRVKDDVYKILRFTPAYVEFEYVVDCGIGSYVDTDVFPVSLLFE